MIEIKEQFSADILSGLSKYNILPLSLYEIEPFLVSEKENNYLRENILTPLVNKNYNFKSFVLDRFYKGDFYFVLFRKYIFPAFLNKEGILFINLLNKGISDIFSHNVIDLYSYCLYGFILEKSIKNRKRLEGTEILVSNYIYSVFVRLFQKVSGLLSSEKLLINLLYFVFLYVHVSFFGYPNNDKTKKLISGYTLVDYKKLNTDFDFSSIDGLFEALNKNNIIKLSSYVFYNKIVNRFDVYSIPIFEDLSRFFSTIGVSSIKGNSVVSTDWYRINIDIYKKIIDFLYGFLEG